MAHFLNASQLAEECNALGLYVHERMLINAAAAAGDAIAARHGIAVTSEASNEPGFAGLCVGFGPATNGQVCPPEFVHYDSGSSWAENDMDDGESDITEADVPYIQGRL